MEKIEELLERLQELDEATATRFGMYNIFQRDDHRMLWVLGGVIQDAITAPEKKWALVIECPVKDSDWWGVEIMGRETGVGRIRIGPTAAEAILAAYVALLEALEARRG